MVFKLISFYFFKKNHNNTSCNNINLSSMFPVIFKNIILNIINTISQYIDVNSLIFYRKSASSFLSRSSVVQRPEDS